jgi:hypothetical protein
MKCARQSSDQSANCSAVAVDNLFSLFALGRAPERGDCRHYGRNSVDGNDWQRGCISAVTGRKLAGEISKQAREDHEVSEKMKSSSDRIAKRLGGKIR